MMIASHNAFQGTVGFFATWRGMIHKILYPTSVGTLANAQNAGVYDDQTQALNTLLQPGTTAPTIPTELCGPLADTLVLLSEKIPTDMPFMHVVTANFVAGLRSAAAAGEPLTFSQTL